MEMLHRCAAINQVMEVRVLTRADAKLFFERRLEALEHEPRAFGASVEEDRALPLETVATRLEAKPDGAFVVGAFVDGALAGMAGFYREERLKTRHKGFIWGVYVAPHYRRQGIARRMLAVVIERLRTYLDLDHVVLHVSTDRDAPRRLYASLGFETIGCERRAFKIDDEYVDQEQMVLWLS